MPELPEAEVVRRGLETWAAHRHVRNVQVYDARSLRRHDAGPADFGTRLEGRLLGAPQRRGKFLWIPLGASALDPPALDTKHGAGQPIAEALVIHLGMSGQVLIQDADAPEQKHLRIQLELESSLSRPTQLRFVDQRIFGGMQLSVLVPGSHASGSVPACAAHIAWDPLEPSAGAESLFNALRSRRTGLKRALLDQEMISGIGNIYADEALWRARLHYARRTETVTRAEAARLLESVREVMEAALEAGGTSFDSLYVNINGRSGYFERSLGVYGRAGQPCTRCGTAIIRERFMNRSSHFCPRCQPKR